MTEAKSDTMSGSGTAGELPDPGPAARIVVGYDGSLPSLKALDWAIEEARQRSAVLDVVTAWTFPMALGYSFVHTVHEVEQTARAALDMALSHVAERDPEVVSRGEDVDDAPGPALVRAARGADMLVVGCRGLGGFETLLLGSVSDYCAKHASCTVVVVR